MNTQTPRETPTGGPCPHRAPGEVLTAAEKAGLLRPAADVQPLSRPGAGLLLRVLGGLYAWQGPARCSTCGRAVCDCP